MLYLEDFLELIEVFPDIVKERLTEMRVIDLDVENAFDKLKNAETNFFKRCPMMDSDSRQREYREAITKVYDQCIEKIDEKIHSASQLLDMVERYIYKQETEVSKFKLELEADNGGVTEILERQVGEEADKQQQLLRLQRHEKKRHHNRQSNSVSGGGAGGGGVAGSVGQLSGGTNLSTGLIENGLSSGASAVKRMKVGDVSSDEGSPCPSPHRVSSVAATAVTLSTAHQPILTLDRVDATAPLTHATSSHTSHQLHNGGLGMRCHSVGSDLSSLSSNTATGGGSGDPTGGAAALCQIGAASSNAIAAAASQAIAATQQMPQGRRTASLKASYAAVAKGTAGLQHYLTSGAGSLGAGGSSSNMMSSQNNSRLVKSMASSRMKKLGTLSKSASSVTLSSIAGISGNRKSTNTSLHTSRSVATNLASAGGMQLAYSTGSSTVGAGAGPSEGGGKGPLAGFSGLHFKGNGGGGGVSSEEGEPEFVSDDGYSDQADNQLYCKCRQVSYGDMIACDNPDCPIEWFHYPCVNLVSAPKGKWFCPDCIVSMKRRGMKKI